MKIRLRVGDLDSWLDYVDPQFEGVGLSTEQFFARMNRTQGVNSAMMAGSALHKLLEHARPGDEYDEFIGAKVDGVRLRFDIDHELALPAEREPAIIEEVFPTRYGDVLLRGRIDGEEVASTIVDYKLTASSFNAERFARSMQWKAYSTIKGSKRFKYIVFQSKQEEVVEDGESVLDVWIHNVHVLPLWSYPEMKDEVQAVVSDLAGFVVENIPALCE